jgi:hypothetical protein
MLDQYHDVDQMFRDAIDLSERMHEDAVQETSPTRRQSFHACDPEEGNIRRLEQLYDQASVPLYNGSSVSTISAVVVLMNMCTTHGSYGTSNTF